MGPIHCPIHNHFFLSLAFAWTPQQERMKACNAEAGEKKLAGDERKAFMSTCLKGQAPAPTTQQEKMKVCNKEAGVEALKGDERKKFMSECLSSDKKS